MRENYNEYDKFSGLYREKRKPSFLVIVLIGLLLLLVCSIGYDNIVKPYLVKRKQKTEKQIEPTPSETESVTASEPDIIISDEKETVAEKVYEKPIPRTKEFTSKQNYPVPAPIQKVEGKKETSESEHQVHPEKTIMNNISVPSKNEENKNLSVTEILERQTHADVVKQAKRAGVSTEGTTTQILERITHADVVKQAKRAGVSTEGSTSDILERITKKEMEKYGY